MSQLSKWKTMHSLLWFHWKTLKCIMTTKKCSQTFMFALVPLMLWMMPGSVWSSVSNAFLVDDSKVFSMPCNFHVCFLWHILTMKLCCLHPCFCVLPHNQIEKFLCCEFWNTAACSFSHGFSLMLWDFSVFFKWKNTSNLKFSF